MTVKEAQSSSRTTKAAQTKPTPKELPTDGMSRYTALKPFVPLSRETIRQLQKVGKFPQPITLSSRCVMYRNADVHEWLKDPVNYRAEVA